MLALRDRAGRAMPVHRRRDVGRDDPLEARLAAAASRRPSSRISTSTRSRPGRATPSRSPRLAEIRDLAQTLDVHRAIIAPRSADAGEMLNLVRTLKAVGVRVSVVAAAARGGRLLRRVRRPARRDGDGRAALRPDALLGDIQARLRRDRRFARTARGLAAADRDRDRDQARQPRPGLLPPAAGRPARQALLHAQVPHDGAGGGGDEGRTASPQRGDGGAVQDRRGPPHHARRALAARAAPWTSCRSS